MNLHDWIDELADVLDVETEVDEGLILDLARVAAQNVQKTAAPITSYLLGFAAGAGDANPEQIERLAAKAQQLAGVLDADRLAAVRPDLEGQHGMALHRLLAPLSLAEVPADGDEAVDIDSWTDLRDLDG